MNMFAQLPENIRETISTSAGILLDSFDPDASGMEEKLREHVIMATNGGVSVSCVPTLRDFGSDIDNCPKNTMELAEVEGWDCTFSGTGVTVTKKTATASMGAAAATDGESGMTEIQPTMTLKKEHFQTMWYVCPYGTAGGFVAAKLENALSTGGFSMQSTDREKGKYAFTFKGYSSIEAPEKVPFTFYIKPGAEAAAEQVDIEGGE